MDTLTFATATDALFAAAAALLHSAERGDFADHPDREIIAVRNGVRCGAAADDALFAHEPETEVTLHVAHLEEILAALGADPRATGLLSRFLRDAHAALAA